MAATVADPAAVLHISDVLNHIATLLEWHFVTISRGAAVCKSWQMAFAPRLASLPARLREATSELFNDELLRRPVMWDMRLAAALEGMEKLTLSSPLHDHVCSTIEELRFGHGRVPDLTSLSEVVGRLVGVAFLLAGVGDPAPERPAESIDVWKSCATRRLAGTQSCREMLESVDLVTVPSATLCIIRVITRAHEWLQIESEPRMRSFGPLILWVKTVVDMCDLFEDYPEVASAYTELKALQALQMDIQRRLAQVGWRVGDGDEAGQVEGKDNNEEDSEDEEETEEEEEEEGEEEESEAEEYDWVTDTWIGVTSGRTRAINAGLARLGERMTYLDVNMSAMP